MGKYYDEMRRVQEQHRISTGMRQRTMAMFGSQMDDFGRSWNQAHAQIEDDMYQRDMARLLPLVQKEMAEEIKRDVLKSMEVEVVDQASPAIREINKELDKLFKR